MSSSSGPNEQSRLKRIAAESAVKLVRSGMVLGLGSGSTALLAIQQIAEKLNRNEFRDLIGVPTSKEVELKAASLGISLAAQECPPRIDLTIDGADEVDPQLNLIKGGGGALLREKIVAQRSEREVIIVDESKMSAMLGTEHPLPVEVTRFAWAAHAEFLAAIGAAVALRQTSHAQPFVTDQGNYILDCVFGPIHDPGALAGKLAAHAGIVEHGLFLGLATDVIVARADGVEHLTRAR